jgi:hypothetical protein
MSHTRKKRARAPRRTGTNVVTSVILGVGLVLFLCFALVVVIGQGNKAVNASGGGPGSPVGTVKGRCGNPGQPSCPVDPGWFPVTSESPAVVTAALARSRDVVMMRAQYGYTLFDAPILVHHYGRHTGMDYFDDDHWVVSVRNTLGQECGIFDFVYDRTNHRLRFSSFGVITSTDPHAHQAFPYITSSMAVAKLQQQLKRSVMAGVQPKLIFFPIDPHWRNLRSPVSKWAGGGQSPMDPMWHLIGTDGHDYFVGEDLRVYISSDLPFAKV